MKELDWNAARAFCATADTGSLSAAARKLGLTQPTMSRQVAALEAGLKVTLFERVGKRLVLTESGRALLAHARTMAAAADAMALAAEGTSTDISGRVIISATDAFATYLLSGIVSHIRALAPEITLVVLATDSLSDLQRREADIAIRHVRPTEPDLTGCLVAEMTAHFYAADSWVARHGRPQTPADMAHIDLLGFEPIERFVAHLTMAGIPITTDQCRVVSASAVALWEMTRRGLGVSLMLRECARLMPELVPLLPDFPGIRVPVWLVTHREVHTSKRVRLVFDAIAGKLAQGGADSARLPPRGGR